MLPAPPPSANRSPFLSWTVASVVGAALGLALVEAATGASGRRLSPADNPWLVPGLSAVSAALAAIVLRLTRRHSLARGLLAAAGFAIAAVDSVRGAGPTFGVILVLVLSPITLGIVGNHARAATGTNRLWSMFLFGNRVWAMFFFGACGAALIARSGLPVGVLLAAGLTLAAIATLLPKPDTAPWPRRWDLRASLALGSIVLTGLLAGFALTQFAAALLAPREHGGAGWTARTLPLAIVGVPLLLAMASLIPIGANRKALRIVLGLATTVLGCALLALARETAWFAIALTAFGAGLFLIPSIEATDRASRELWLPVLALAFGGGTLLANGLVAAFSRPLPGLMVVAGAEVSQRTAWAPVVGFYAALALVVLLAHLAHVYEFGLDALSPDDDRDPLPILRKGLAGLRR